MTGIDIRRVSVNEVSELQKLGKQTFLEAFAKDNSEENMEKYLSQGFSIERLSNELNNQNSEFYFAILQNEAIGYLKINYGEAQTEMLIDNSVEIERIYVLKEFYGKQVGQKLYNKALQLAGQKSASYVWLGVWEENPRAIRFYEKNGFVAFDKHIFKLGTDEQTDIMMKLRL